MSILNKSINISLSIKKTINCLKLFTKLFYIIQKLLIFYSKLTILNLIKILIIRLTLLSLSSILKQMNV
jgi:hypothetical protein